MGFFTGFFKKKDLKVLKIANNEEEEQKKAK